MKNTIYQTGQLGADSMVKEFSFKVSSTVLQVPDEKKAKFTRAYIEYYPSLMRYCLFKLSNQEKAVDLVSDTFTRMWCYIQQGNTIEYEKSFLYTTAQHLIIDEYRKKKNMSLEVLLSAGFEASLVGEKDVYNCIENDFFVKEISKLPIPYNSIIHMRYVNDYSVSHISHVSGNSENNVSVKIHRGLVKLREILLERYGPTLL